MTSETVGQMVTAALVIAAWFLSRTQAKNTHKEVTDVKSIVNGPLLQSIRETAALARKIASLTGLPEDSAIATEKEKALDERLKAVAKENHP